MGLWSDLDSDSDEPAQAPAPAPAPTPPGLAAGASRSSKLSVASGMGIARPKVTEKNAKRPPPPDETRPCVDITLDDPDALTVGRDKRRHRPVPPPADVVIIDLEEATGAGTGVSGMPLLPGELVARQKHQPRFWTLCPSRDLSTSDTAENRHFRLAESAWSRGGGGGHYGSIASIEYHFNPKLEAAWHKKKAEYDARFGVNQHTILFAFHGTRSGNVRPILADGFKVDKVGSSTDPGFYGAGIYFSEQLAMSQAYNAQNTHGMLLCKLLVGLPAKVSVHQGQALKPGCTSHVADENGSEVIIFDEAAMLPVYLIKAGARHTQPAAKESLKGLVDRTVPPASRGRAGALGHVLHAPHAHVLHAPHGHHGLHGHHGHYGHHGPAFDPSVDDAYTAAIAADVAASMAAGAASSSFSGRGHRLGGSSTGGRGRGRGKAAQRGNASAPILLDDDED